MTTANDAALREALQAFLDCGTWDDHHKAVAQARRALSAPPPQHVARAGAPRADGMGMKHKRKSYDSKCYELAEYFLDTVTGATEDDRTALAETLQMACEDQCQEVEKRKP